MPDGYEFEPTAQAPPRRYSSFARGVVGGFLGDIESRQLQQQQNEREARQNALRWLTSLPMSEHNAPIITKMSLDVLASKPGKKHWSDQLFGKGKASNEYIDNLWSELRGILPPDTPERMPMATAGPATRARTATSPNPSPFGSAMLPNAIGGSPMGDIPEPPLARPDPRRLSFSNLPGKWQTDPTTYYDEGGQAYRYGFDQTGRSDPRRYSLGQVTTDSREIAEYKAGQQGQVAEQNRYKQMIASAAQFAGMDPIAFAQMPSEFKAPYFQLAGKLGVDERLGKAALTAQNTITSGTRSDLNKSMSKFYDQSVASGGVTPNAQLSNYQTNLAAARKYKEEYDELASKAIAAKQMLDGLLKPTTPVEQALQAAGAPDYMNKLRAAQMAYVQAAGAVKTKASQAGAMFPGFLKESPDGIEILPPSTRFQGGANPGAMMAPSAPAMPSGRPSAPTYNPATKLDYSATGDLPPVGAVTVPSGGTVPIGGPGAIIPKSPPQRDFKPGSEPPKVMMQTPGSAGPNVTLPSGRRAYSGIIQGTASAPASLYEKRAGQVVTIGGKQVRIIGTSPPSKTAPYGLILTAPVQ